VNGRVSRLAVCVAALAAAACTAQPQRSPAERATDQALAARVEMALADNPRIYARHIDVDATGGIVALSGYVWSTGELYAAREIAASVPGVLRVDSELELKLGGRSGR
jgi:osmotically-inducible protein OsmY